MDAFETRRGTEFLDRMPRYLLNTADAVKANTEELKSIKAAIEEQNTLLATLIETIKWHH